jgi:hypothetical protein
MKKLMMSILLLIVLGFTVTYQQEIVNHIMINYVYKKEIVIQEINEYKRDLDFNYVKRTDNFFPKSEEDILNIFYTVLNNGWDEFTFYCDTEYESCLDDIQRISHDEYIFSNVNNFVHPYNSYNRLSINYNNLGKISIQIEKLYTSAEISAVNNKVNEIYSSIIKDNMSTRDKILAIHDHIINTTDYDNERAEIITKNISNYPYTYESHKAFGTLLQGMAICSGYSDAMAVFLNKMGIPNYKVASKDHVWNLVYLDNNWYHLDLTWDDPIVDTNEPILVHNYFLITTKELEKEPNDQHIYSKDVYSEAR